MAKNVKLIIGSARKNRLGPVVAAWVENIAKQSDIHLEVIDVKELALPQFDAPVPPAYAPTEVEEGKTWAKQVVETDGFIFVTPEYNRSIPSSLKNAIDYLSPEWADKPAVIVSYGYIDGGKGATAHLKDIFDWLKIVTIEPRVALQLSQDLFNDDGSFKDIDQAFSQYEDPLTSAVKQLV